MSTFTSEELDRLAEALVKTAKRYQEGGDNAEGYFYFGNTVTFRHLDTVVRDVNIAKDMFTRDGFLGLTAMLLCDALRILTEDGKLEVGHLKALGNQEAVEQLNIYFDKRNPANNPLTGSGMKAILTQELQRKLKEGVGRSEEEITQLQQALAKHLSAEG